MLEPPPGTIADARQCEELCDKYETLGCEYWVFVYGDRTCQLLKSDDRTCTATGGPETPPLTECLGKIQ